MRTLWVLAVGAGVAMLSGGTGAQEAPKRWSIHEWGTFTALQGESGKPIGWINTEDEPVPPFCHRLSRALLVPVDDLAPTFFKDAPRAHPDVILRLETPVVYFHPPASAKLPVKADLRVDFRGGWLTEYYPDAKVGAPGLQNKTFQYGRLRSDTKGSLEWKGLEIGKQGTFPKTDDAVWLSPRNVKAAPVTTANGESEQFLFYRGVAYMQAPLIVSRGTDGKMLSIQAWTPPGLEDRGPLRIPRLWLADIREDGSTAYRTLPGLKLSAAFTSAPLAFEEKDYSADRLQSLRKEMHEGLTVDGLNPDEADALLNTWDASYFRSHGLRLFFLVPRAWTDHVLPLKTTLDADITRVMVGRIELITRKQRACVARIRNTKSPSSTWYQEWAAKHPDAWKRFQQKREEGNLGALRDEKIAIPDDYLAYLELGRFRNAIVLSELQDNPTEGLQNFVDAYDLHEAKIADSK